jgi:tetratricopeptide (TPR) repeat protein
MATGRPGVNEHLTFALTIFVLALAISAGAFIWAGAQGAASPTAESSPGAAPSPPADPCQRANDLIAAGDLAGAEAELKAAGECSSTPVAQPAPSLVSGTGEMTGAERLQQARVNAGILAQAGQEAELAGDRLAALELYRRALALDASQPVATARVAALVPAVASPSPAPYAVARALRDAGFRDAAKEAALAEVKERAGKGKAADFPADLDSLREGIEPLETLETALARQPLWWIPVGLTALATIVALFAVRNARRDHQHRLEFGTISPNGDAIAPGMKALIAEEIGYLRNRIVGDHLAIVTAPEDKLDIPVDVVEELPQGKLIAAVVKFLSPTPWTLSGTLLWDPVRGDGIALALVDPYKRSKEQVIWDSELRPGDQPAPSAATTAFGAPHARLARAAGAWLAFERAEGRSLKTLMSRAATSWSSYALFRIGAEAHAGQDGANAAKSYAKALGEDPMNPGAAFNEATRTLMAGAPTPTDSTYLSTAAQLLDRVEPLVRAPSQPTLADKGEPNLNTLRYRWTYDRALITFEWAVFAERNLPDSPSDVDRQALRRAWMLAVIATQAASRKVLAETRAGLSRDELLFLDLVEDAAFLLYGGALARFRASASSRSGRMSELGKSDIDRVETDDPSTLLEDKPTVVRPLQSRREYRLAMAEAVKVENLGTADVRAVVDAYGAWRLPARARYNYACLLADLGQSEEAVKVLRELMGDPQLAARARTDPALIKLRSSAAWKALVPNDLKALRVIGKTWADRLATAKIDTVDALMARTRSPGAIVAVARETQATEGLVQQWVDAARLLTCVGVSAAEANLLDAAGITTLSDLVAAPVDALVANLAAITKDGGYADTPPDKAKIELWITKARICEAQGDALMVEVYVVD